jgi:hypothetical protein
MATLKSGLVDRVKKAAAQAGTRGAKALVETTAAAVKTVDKLQEKLGRRPAKAEPPKPRKTSTPTAKPLPVALREAGRKTVAAAAPKRSKASAAPGFKVKRGQKHPHTGR